MQKEKYTNQIQDNDTINIRAELEKYLIHWKWFVLGTILALTGAFAYLRYSTPKYSASSTVLIKNDKKGGISEELAAFEDLGIVGGSSKNIDNEIEVIKSRKLISGVISKLNLDISYFTQGRIKQSEVYNNIPISISFDNPEKKTDTVISVIIESKNSYSLLDQNENKIESNISFGDVLQKSNLNNFKVEKSSFFKEGNIGDIFKIVIKPIDRIIDSYINGISINPINKKSSVLKLTLQSPIKEKAEDILDELVDQYNNDAIKDKKSVSEKTSAFISERLVNIGKQLALLDDNVKKLKAKIKLQI